jgi:hypothetical protein
MTFRGALVYRLKSHQVFAGPHEVAFYDTVLYDTDGFWDGGSKFIIPAGVHAVKLSNSIIFEGNGSGARQLVIKRNRINGDATSGFYPGVGPETMPANSMTTTDFGVQTPVLPVRQGDAFQTEVLHSSGVSLNALAAGGCWFAIEVVETDALVEGFVVKSIPPLCAGAPNAVPGYSVRSRLGPLGGPGTQVRVTLAGNASDGTKFDHVSIGVATGLDSGMVSAPVELKFGGSSGVVLGANEFRDSDWADLSFATADRLVVAMDYSSSKAGTRQSNGQGGGDSWYKESCASWNVAAPSGFNAQSGYVYHVQKVEAK